MSNLLIMLFSRLIAILMWIPFLAVTIFTVFFGVVMACVAVAVLFCFGAGKPK